MTKLSNEEQTLTKPATSADMRVKSKLNKSLDNANLDNCEPDAI